jgi:hypothetical protein
MLQKVDDLFELLLDIVDTGNVIEGEVGDDRSDVGGLLQLVGKLDLFAELLLFELPVLSGPSE